MTAPAGQGTDRAPQRVRTAYVEAVSEWMSARDWLIVETVNTLRVASGQQLERLLFAELAAGRSRTVTRSRVLARLVGWRVLVPVGRRVGGSGRGSTVQAFALDSAGRRLLVQRGWARDAHRRVRRPGAPGARTLAHLLAVSELYTALVETCRASGLPVPQFVTEPAAWWPDGRGGVLKPDAYAVLEREGARDHWWVEVDLATESLPTVAGKLAVYLEFRRRGGRGPAEVTPWVLVAAITSQRRDAISALVQRLPEAGEVVRVVHSPEAARFMVDVLLE